MSQKKEWRCLQKIELNRKFTDFKYKFMFLTEQIYILNVRLCDIVIKIRPADQL